MDYVFETASKVRDCECDMQGIVNNAVCLSHLEHARQEYLASKGLTFKYMVENNIIARVTHAGIDFEASLKSGGTFTVKIRVARHLAKIIFFQDIYNAGDDKSGLHAKIEMICKITGKGTRGDIFDRFIN